MNLKNYLSDTKLELTKVTWPTKNKVLTLVVVIFVIVVFTFLYISLADVVLSFITNFIRRTF